MLVLALEKLKLVLENENENDLSVTLVNVFWHFYDCGCRLFKQMYILFS